MMILNRIKSRKYRYMDANLTQRRKGLEDKIPDIRKTLNMVEFLQERRVGPLSRVCCKINIDKSFRKARKRKTIWRMISAMKKMLKISKSR